MHVNSFRKLMLRWQPVICRDCLQKGFSLSLRQISFVVASTVALTLGPAQVQAQTAGDGVSIQPRVIGGQASPQGSFPSVMPILVNRSGRSQFERQICGATLIAPTWALTAAHCFFNNRGGLTIPPYAVSVLPGKNRLSTDRQGDRSDEVRVVSIYGHPQFRLSSFTNDVALLELAEPVDQPVISLYSGDASSLVGAGALVVGWGVTDDSNPNRPISPRDQQYARVPIISNRQCNAPYSYNGAINSTQICAGAGRGVVDACYGDSGGPLIIGINGQQTQVGIVSWGVDCAKPNFYGVYTNVSAVRSWISTYVDASYASGRRDSAVSHNKKHH